MTRLSLLAAIAVGLALLTGCADNLVGEPDLAATPLAVAAASVASLSLDAEKALARCTEETFFIDGADVALPSSIETFYLNPGAGYCVINEVSWSVEGNGTLLAIEKASGDPTLSVQVKAGNAFGGSYTVVARVRFFEDSVVTVRKVVSVSSNTCADATVTISGPTTLEVNGDASYTASMPEGCDIETISWSAQGRARIAPSQTGLPDELQLTVRVLAGAIPGAFTLTAQVVYNAANTATGTLSSSVRARDLRLATVPSSEVDWDLAQVVASGATECTLYRRARSTHGVRVLDEHVWAPTFTDSEFSFSPNGNWRIGYEMNCTIPGRDRGSSIVVARGSASTQGYEGAVAAL